MFGKPCRVVGQKIVRTSRYRAFRAGKHVVACASHTVYYGSAEIFAHALIESGVHIACNFSYGRVSGVKLSDNALIVRLNEIDAALGEIFMKRAEKPFERRIIGLYYDSAVGCSSPFSSIPNQ